MDHLSWFSFNSLLFLWNFSLSLSLASLFFHMHVFSIQFDFGANFSDHTKVEINIFHCYKPFTARLYFRVWIHAVFQYGNRFNPCRTFLFACAFTGKIPLIPVVCVCVCMFESTITDLIAMNHSIKIVNESRKKIYEFFIYFNKI